MDSAQRGSYSLNELILTLDLSGRSGVILSFHHKEFRDENHVMPDRFIGAHKSDGVAISADGTTWHKVQGLTSVDGIRSVWMHFEVDLDKEVIAAGIDYNSSFKIKFQQYDNYPIGTDGFAFDDIELYQNIVDNDYDGLPDDWEIQHFGELSQEPDADFDSDGLSNLSEYQETTDPTQEDTDDDGMPDGWEVYYGLDPKDPSDADEDLDGDGKSNVEEYLGGTDPSSAPLSSANFPFFEDFERGDLQGCWKTLSTGTGRISMATSNVPFSGARHLTMDSAVRGTYSLNELILTIDLSGQSEAVLSFYHKEFSDENHAMPDMFTGSHNSDGVAISADGTTWYRVQGLTSVDGISSGWKRYEIALDAEAAAAGIDYTSTFMIKFQQYDNYPIATDGFAFDDVSVDVSKTGGGGDPGGLLAQEQELIDLVNQVRQQNGLHPLNIDAALVAAAKRHSTDMAQNNFMSHTGSDGSSPWDRMADAGYRLYYGGENVAAGYPTAGTVLNGWMNSPGHRDNILNSNFLDLGVGYAFGDRSTYGHYWTLTLGSQR
jgi:uncharacterized protein YkwD